MSNAQWAGMMMGDESYAGATSWYRFKEVVRDITGFDTVLPTHQVHHPGPACCDDMHAHSAAPCMPGLAAWMKHGVTLPAWQGRAAERILFQALNVADKLTLSNGHFDTTRCALCASCSTFLPPARYSSSMRKLCRGTCAGQTQRCKAR
jgi:tryptophanase